MNETKLLEVETLIDVAIDNYLKRSKNSVWINREVIELNHLRNLVWKVIRELAKKNLIRIVD